MEESSFLCSYLPLWVDRCIDWFLPTTDYPCDWERLNLSQFIICVFQICSVAQLCPALCDSMDCSVPDFLAITDSWSLFKLMSIELVMPSDHLNFCCPLLLPPSISPSIRAFSSESVFRIRWPKYWSLSFSTSPSNEHSGLISFRMDWLDLLAVQGTLESSPTPQFKSIRFLTSFKMIRNAVIGISSLDWFRIVALSQF